jgi:hypothetical protein
MQRMNVGELQRRLDERGVSVLTATDSTLAADELTIYLLEHDGRLNQEDAIRCLNAMPEVAHVEVAAQSWTILRVSLTPSGEGAEAVQAPRD